MRMRSRELDLTRYDTDKVANGYLPYYDEVFATRPKTTCDCSRSASFKVDRWLSARLFPSRDYRRIDEKLRIAGALGERVRLFEGSQCDTAFLSRVAAQADPAVSTSSSMMPPSRLRDQHLLLALFENHLKPGGLFAIEVGARAIGAAGRMAGSSFAQARAAVPRSFPNDAICRILPG